MAVILGASVVVRWNRSDSSPPSPERSSQPTTTAVPALSDAALVFCDANLELVLQAAASLVTPTEVIDEADPRFRNADGSRRMDDLEAAWREANARPGVLPRYVEPTDELSRVRLVTGSPWKWYRTNDFLRACEAAFEAH
jgi:hypothetical protein